MSDLQLIKIEHGRSGVTIEYDGMTVQEPTLEHAIMALADRKYQLGKLKGEKKMLREHGIVVKVLSISATHFHMPTCLVQAVKYPGTPDEEKETHNLRLGAELQIDGLFVKN